MTYTFERQNSSIVDKKKYYDFANKRIFTTKAWLRFVELECGGDLYVCSIEKSGITIGYFTGFIVRKFGVKIFGSPLSGWATSYMGIDIKDDYIEDKSFIYKELISFLIKKEKIDYIEIIDRDVKYDQALEAGLIVRKYETLSMPIDLSNEELFHNMKTDCRNFIRQFERRGAMLQVAAHDEEFIKNFDAQITDVFAKQGKVPNWGGAKVRCLLSSLDESNILCLQVLDPSGNSIATSVFPGYNNTFYFWAGASFRSGQHYRPNEYMLWTAIKYWRDKGCREFDMVGVRAYKKKFGSKEVELTQILGARYKWLLVLRDCAAKAFYLSRDILGKIRGRK